MLTKGFLKSGQEVTKNIDDMFDYNYMIPMALEREMKQEKSFQDNINEQP